MTHTHLSGKRKVLFMGLSGENTVDLKRSNSDFFFLVGMVWGHLKALVH